MSKTGRKLVKGSTLRTVSYLAQIVVLFFLTPFVVFSLGDRMYGFWTLVGTLIGYYGMLDLGLSYAVNRYIAGAIGAEDKEECNRVFNTAFVLFLIFGCVALGISIILAALTPFMMKTRSDAALFAKVILVLGVNMAVELPLRVFLGALTSQLRFDIISALQLLSLFLRTSLIVLVLVLGYGVLALALVTVLSSIPQKILTIYFARKNLPIVRFNRKACNLLTAKTLFSYSIYAFIAQIADILRFNIDFVVITAFMGLSAVTHYKIGSLLATHFLTFVVTCIGIFLPVFSRLHGEQDHEGIRRTFFFANKISIYMTSFIAFGLIFWGRPFITRWMGPGYLDAYPVLFILVLGFVLLLWQAPTGDFLFGTSRQKFVGYVNIIEGVSNLLLSLILVRHFGLIGVAMGTFIPMAIIKLVIQPIYVCSAFKIRYFGYMQRLAKVISISGLALVFPAVISIIFAAPDYRVLFALGLISSSIYILIMWFYGFSPSEVRILREAVFPKLPKTPVFE